MFIENYRLFTIYSFAQNVYPIKYCFFLAKRGSDLNLASFRGLLLTEDGDQIVNFLAKGNWFAFPPVITLLKRKFHSYIRDRLKIRASLVLNGNWRRSNQRQKIMGRVSTNSSVVFLRWKLITSFDFQMFRVQTFGVWLLFLMFGKK